MFSVCVQEVPGSHNLWCPACKVLVPGETEVPMHLAGVKHREGMDGNLWDCLSCNGRHWMIDEGRTWYCPSCDHCTTNPVQHKQGHRHLMSVKAAVARGLHVDGQGRTLLFLSRARHPEVHRSSRLEASVGTASSFMRRVNRTLPVPPRLEPVARVLSFASPAPVVERKAPSVASVDLSEEADVGDNVWCLLGKLCHRLSQDRNNHVTLVLVLLTLVIVLLFR